MNFQEALKEVGKHQPCPHDALQTDLGNGKVWARCEDCGQTIRQESIPRLRAEHERFLWPKMPHTIGKISSMKMMMPKPQTCFCKCAFSAL